ncbi:MAG: hypothetical protein Q9201_003110 [Fulgogasparrea decipioides]
MFHLPEPNMPGNISLAWAINVGHAQLGARLEAYVETKAAITAFKACVRHTTIHSMSQLAPELVEIIADALKDTVYLRKVPQWLSERKCLLNECRSRDHFTKAERYDCLLDVLMEVDYDLCSDDEDDYLLEQGMEIHDEIVLSHLDKITIPASGKRTIGRFARCKEVGLARCSFLINAAGLIGYVCHQILVQDFNIRPYFTVLKSYHDDDYPTFESARISAYLTVSIVDSSLASEPGSAMASYTVENELDRATVLQGVSNDLGQRFKAATKALRLEAPHTYITAESERLSDLEGDILSDEESNPDEGNMADQDMGPTRDSVVLSEANNEDGDKVTDENMGHKGDIDSGHVGSEARGKRAIVNNARKVKKHCLDCGTEFCQGEYKAQAPKLMMLGSGDLPAYSVYY